MAKKTNITNVINVNTIGQESFAALLDVQKKSVEHLDTISAALKQSLLAQRSSAIEELIIANNQQAQTEIFKDISKTLEDIAKSLKVMAQSSSILTSGNVSSSKTPSAVATVGKEEKQEAQRSQEEQKSVLVKIEKNTEGLSSLAKVSKPAAEGGEGGLGLGLTALATGLGVVLGAIQAQVKAITYFADLLTPDFIILKAQKAIASFAAGVSMTYDLFKISVSERISSIINAFDDAISAIKAAISEKFPTVAKIMDNIVDSVKGFFNLASEESTMTKLIKNVMAGLDVVIAPFADAFKIVKDFFSGPTSAVFETIKGIFSTIGTAFDDFGKLFSSVAKVVSKLLIPLNIIMTLWDTVKGAIEGYEEEGIIGGIRGAITGFFNSLIFGPLNMLKDAIAWVAGFFGFDKAEATLKSFNLEQMFKDFMKMVFSPIETFKGIVQKVKDFFSSLKGFEIPGFGFTAPKWIPGLGGKEFKFGPWYPFGKAEQTNDTTKPGDSPGAVIPQSVKPEVDASGFMTGRALFEFNKQETLARLRESMRLSDRNAELVTSGTNQVNALRENKPVSVTTVVAPAINNVNNSQTQVARIEAPVRNIDSTYDRYMYERVGW